MDAASRREYKTLCERLAALDAQRGFVVARMQQLREEDGGSDHVPPLVARPQAAERPLCCRE
jgi:hypothetical protein